MHWCSCSTTTHHPPPLRTDLNLKEAYTGIVQKILVNLHSSTLKVRCTESSLAVPCWTNLCLAVVEIHCLPPKILLCESSQSIEVSRAKRGLPPNNNMPRVILNNCQLSVSVDEGSRVERQRRRCIIIALACSHRLDKNLLYVCWSEKVLQQTINLHVNVTPFTLC